MENYPVNCNVENHPVNYYVENYPVNYNVENHPVNYNLENYPANYNVENHPVNYNVENYPVNYNEGWYTTKKWKQYLHYFLLNDECAITIQWTIMKDDDTPLKSENNTFTIFYSMMNVLSKRVPFFMNHSSGKIIIIIKQFSLKCYQP